MIDLNENTENIKKFLSTSINRFQSENEKPNSIGIYCCPWSGWITTNFNVNTKLTETENNCPDFDYVEYDFMEIPEWQEEYENDKPEFKVNGSIINHNHDLGDENINELIFEYLKPIVSELKNNYNSDFLLQMLDSRMVEEI